MRLTNKFPAGRLRLSACLKCAKPQATGRRHRGMALMLVLVVVALVAVLGYAMLASSTTQAQISSNAASIAQADCLAESGVNYALYCLQYPYNSPTPASTFWTGGTISLGSSVPGTVTVLITNPSNDGLNFLIQSSTSYTGSNGAAISRTVNSSVLLTRVFGVANQAAGFASSVSFPASATVHITGDLHTTGSVVMNANSTISGNVYAQNLTLNNATPPAGFSQIATPASTVPTTVTDYTTYTYNGVSYSAKLLTTDPVAGTTLGPTVTNPAGIYYTSNRNVNLNGVTINGSLLIKGSGTTGSLTVKAAGNTITPMSGFPGLVVQNQLTTSGSNQSLTVNGLTWISKGIGTSGSGANLTINGSLLTPSGTPIAAGYQGTINLNYSAANVNVPNFSTTQVQMPSSVKMLSWTQ
jgi:Tfp pilus assembly protein PilX